MKGIEEEEFRRRSVNEEVSGKTVDRLKDMITLFVFEGDCKLFVFFVTNEVTHQTEISSSTSCIIND